MLPPPGGGAKTLGGVSHKVTALGVFFDFMRETSGKMQVTGGTPLSVSNCMTWTKVCRFV